MAGNKRGSAALRYAGPGFGPLDRISFLVRRENLALRIELRVNRAAVGSPEE
ncbi:hypothetical protein GCM10020227_49820 [Streptomyces flavovirens]